MSKRSGTQPNRADGWYFGLSLTLIQSYVALATDTNLDPPTETGVWQLIAQTGAQGAIGATGSPAGPALPGIRCASFTPGIPCIPGVGTIFLHNAIPPVQALAG